MSLATSNIFAALDTKKVKKSSGKTKKDGEKKKKPTEAKKAVDTAELEKQLFSQPVGLASWADDEDDDFTAPVDAGWTQELKKKELEDLDAVFAELGISSKRKKKDKKKSPEGAEGAAQTAAAAAPEEPASEEPGSEDVDEAGAPLDPAAVKAKLAAKKKGAEAAAKKKTASSAAVLAEAKLRQEKAKKKKDTKAYNQMPTR
eukprot:XP_001690833.1 predicted protein [Chlamydomonas reinhardtii]